MRKIYIVLLLLLLPLAFLNAQTIIRSTLGCLGSTSFSSKGVTLKQTIGQPSNTQIFRNDRSVLRQGFQQNNASASFNLRKNEIEFTIFPNPTSENTTIQITEYSDVYSVSINNLQGKTVYVKMNLNEPSHEVNISNLPVGLYIVIVITQNILSSQKLIIN